MPTPIFSFEFSPPGTQRAAIDFLEKIEWAAGFKPAFLDLVCVRGGGNPEADWDMLAGNLSLLKEMRAHAPGIPLILHVPNSRFHKLGAARVVNNLYLDRDNSIDGSLGIMAMGGDGAPLYPARSFSNTELLITGLSRARGKLARRGLMEITVVVDPHEPDAMKRLMDKIEAVPERAVGLAKVVRAVMQYSYDTDLVLDFLKKAEKADLGIEIVPGFMPIRNFNKPDNLKEHRSRKGILVDSLGVPVPPDVAAGYVAIKDKGPEAIGEFATGLAASQLGTVMEATNRFHFFGADNIELTKAVMKKAWPEMLISPEPGGSRLHGARTVRAPLM